MKIIRSGFALLSLLAILLTGVSSTAFGHGFTLSQVGGQLVLDTQGNVRPFRVGYVPTVDINNQPVINDSGNPATFVHELDLTNAMNHGAIGLIADANDQLDLTDAYRLEFAGPLWYSNGVTTTPSASNLSAQSFLPGNVALSSRAFTGNSSIGTLDISAHSSHSIIWSLDGAAADGVYSLAYRALWDDAGGSTDFQASNWVNLLFVTPNFLNSPNLLAAEQNVLAAAVPEPGTLALGVLGIVGIGLVRLRRKK